MDLGGTVNVDGKRVPQCDFVTGNGPGACCWCVRERGHDGLHATEYEGTEQAGWVPRPLKGMLYEQWVLQQTK